jgi:phosphonate C-P lyase system protein PhnH
MDESFKLAGDDLIKARLDQFESQLGFRILLDAFARPGSVLELPPSLSGRVPNALVPLLALLGHGSTFAVLGDTKEYWSKLIQHTTGGIPSEVTRASYVAILGTTDASDFFGISVGSPLRPDFAAHVAIGFDGVLLDETHGDSSSNARIRTSLRGPGIAGERTLAIENPGDTLLGLLELRRLPGAVGFDIWIFDQRGRVVGIPRSVDLQFAKADSSSFGGD